MSKVLLHGRWSHDGDPYHNNLRFYSLEGLCTYFINWSDFNELDKFSCDIKNAYFDAKCRENIWTPADPEFGSEAGTIMIDRISLYGLKSSGADFCANLAETLNYIGFLSTKANPYLCYLPVVKSNGFEYYDYILCYVDDILCISQDPGISLGWIQAAPSCLL